MNQTLQRVEKRATIQDIAQLTGVSVATVSGAFSGKRRMSNQTRELVLAKARELGFEPNPHAQRLRNGGLTNTIGMLSNIDMGVAALTMLALRRHLDKRGFDIDDHLLPLYHKEVETRQTEVLSQICRQNPQGILFAYEGLEPSAFDILQQYVDGGGVLVCWKLSRVLPERRSVVADHVLYDTEEESYLQARHLIELGHREIGFLAHSPIGVAGVRFTGFQRALKEAGIPLRAEWTWGEWGYEEAGIKHAERFMALRDRPTGLCIVNDNSATAFVHSVMRLGVQIPNDLSVIGCDDTPAAASAFVPLTTMRRPVEQISQNIVQLLCDRLDGTLTGAPVSRELKTELIVRNSTAAPRAL